MEASQAAWVKLEEPGYFLQSNTLKTTDFFRIKIKPDPECFIPIKFIKLEAGVTVQAKRAEMAESRLRTKLKLEHVQAKEELQTKIKLEPEEFENETSHSDPEDTRTRNTGMELKREFKNETRSQTTATLLVESSCPFRGMTIIKLEDAMKQIPDTTKKQENTINRSQTLLENVYQRLEYNDMELVTETDECVEKRFPCHKAILSAASPVFEKMIKSQIQGRVFNVSHMMGSEITGDLLKYIYTGDMPEHCGARLNKLLKAAKVLEIKRD